MFKSCEDLHKEFIETYSKEENRGLLCNSYVRICIVQVGNNPASNAYVRGKMNDCEKMNIPCCLRVYPESISEQLLISEVEDICRGYDYTGVIVQLPLPEHISAAKVLSVIPPHKDIDGFNALSHYTPCTPQGIWSFFACNLIRVQGKHVVIVNRSEIVGRPLASIMLEKNATVTVCHSYTENLKEITKRADILVTAVGKPNFITQDMVNENAIIIDVGITRDSDNKMCGDVAKDVVCQYKTPVPKGVGLLTRSAFLQNCLRSGSINAEVRRKDGCNY